MAWGGCLLRQGRLKGVKPIQTAFDGLSEEGMLSTKCRAKQVDKLKIIHRKKEQTVFCSLLSFLKKKAWTQILRQYNNLILMAVF